MADIGERHLGGLGPAASTVMRHYQQQLNTRRIYTAIALVVFLVALAASLNGANDANSGKFFERIPYLFDFLKNFVPDSPLEIFRAMFDLPGYSLDRLRRMGLGQAVWTRHCTYSDPERFFSYRRSVHRSEADYGRLISAIRI